MKKSQWLLRARSKKDAQLHSYWANWTACDNDREQDLANWNAKMYFPIGEPAEIHFDTERDMMLFLLKWS